MKQWLIVIFHKKVNHPIAKSSLFIIIVGESLDPSRGVPGLLALEWEAQGLWVAVDVDFGCGLEGFRVMSHFGVHSEAFGGKE